MIALWGPGIPAASHDIARTDPTASDCMSAALCYTRLSLLAVMAALLAVGSIRQCRSKKVISIICAAMDHQHPSTARCTWGEMWAKPTCSFSATGASKG